MMQSDHAPILAVLQSSRVKPRRPFRFENWWLMEADFRSASRPFHQKARFLASDLRKWIKKRPKLCDQLETIETSINKIQAKPPTVQNHDLEKHLIQQHQNLLEKEAEYHRQRYKKIWTSEGDRNTHFFQQAILKRARRNRIVYLTDEQGHPLTTHEQIAARFNNYFQALFTSQVQQQPDFNAIQDAQTHLPDLQHQHINIPDKEEIWNILKNMKRDAAPGPDGFNVAFYRAAWQWIGDDVTTLVRNFYTSGTLLPEINKTFIVLIPKKNSPVIPEDFRPISLCNVIYKVISKSLADRIKPFLPNKIHMSQSAFIPGRHISSNIITAQEITHSFGLSSWKEKGFLLKIDLAKAFDRIEWSFIAQAMLNMGISLNIVKLVYACISSPDFSVLINGQPSSSFSSERGVRQGCPLSPYLFVLGINELSLQLQFALQANQLSGISLGPGCPPIHSLLFADDLIICGKATVHEATLVRSILQNFCNNSGQTPNWNKSCILFSRWVDNSTKMHIQNLFPVPVMNNQCKHLGHPLLFSYKDRTQAYSFIMNKFRAKLTSIKSNKLNHAGRLIYINSVLASIPVYYMQNILFSKCFMKKINSILRRFWWQGVQEEDSSKSFHFRSWDDICRPKHEGGLGIRKLQDVNKSLVLHSAWLIASDKDSFLARILKAKYFPNTSFWRAPTYGTRSAFWSSILQVKNLLHENSIMQISNGNSNIWNEPWCEGWETIHSSLNLSHSEPSLPNQVSELWSNRLLSWDIRKVESIFRQPAAQRIIATQKVSSTDPDSLCWKPSPQGDCTTKQAFRCIANPIPHVLPSQGPRHISSAALLILRQTWKHKTIPPRIKTFTWRLIRHALATGQRAGSLSQRIDKNCKICGKIENDFHIFFECVFARSVWFAAEPSLRTDRLPPEQDGLQILFRYFLATGSY
ncbi:unnamed protein product [Urochloa humidicola]